MAVIDRALTAKPPSERYIFDGNGASLALMEIKFVLRETRLSLDCQSI